MRVTKGENLHLCQRTVWSQWRGNVKNINVNSTLIRANMQTHKRPYFIFYPCTTLQYFQFFINKACVHVCVWCQSSRQGGVDNLFGNLTVMQKNTGMRMHTWLSAWLPDFLPQIHISIWKHLNKRFFNFIHVVLRWVWRKRHYFSGKSPQQCVRSCGEAHKCNRSSRLYTA